MIEKLKILYVDDEEDLVMLASSFFEEEFLPIDTCTDFLEALEMIKSQHYDLVISDSRMPKGSGRELFTIIKTQYNYKGKCILVTGNVDTEPDQEKNLYDLILYKPLQFKDLIQEAKKILLD